MGGLGAISRLLKPLLPSFGARWLMLSASSRRRSAMLEQKEHAWAREMAALVEEKEELAAELKHQMELDSVS
ncbi:hypothetical protein Hanom_Chr12g01099591 [Helianthus anomalus]